MQLKKIKRVLDLYLNYYLLRRTPIFVYSMERSGSVALLNALKSHGVFVIGAHYLDPRKTTTQRYSGSARWAAKHIISKRRPAKIISLVRHPIDNMLSTFARIDYGGQFIQQENDLPDKMQLNPDQVSREFCEAYLHTNRYLQPLQWFTSEFQAALGINVYDYPFDKQQGFAEFRAGPYDVLLLRTELSDEEKGRLVADFVGVAEIEMTNPTVASSVRRRLPPGKPGNQTEYAAKYKVLKEGVVIPQPYLDTIVDSPFVQHFFTQQERTKMREKYRGGRPAGGDASREIS